MRPLPSLPALLAALLLAAPALAQPQSPVCRAEREGMLACFGTRLCECRWDPGGSITGRPAGHRWDCGPLRPDCSVAPPSIGAAPQAMPDLMLVPQVKPPAQGSMPPGISRPGGQGGMR